VSLPACALAAVRRADRLLIDADHHVRGFDDGIRLGTGFQGELLG
jgi:hypothetical protein